MKKTTPNSSICICSAVLFLGLSTVNAEGYMYKDKYNPAVVFGEEGLNDRGFNQMAFGALKKYMRESKNKVIHTLLSDSEKHHLTIQVLAQRGANPIITIGFSQEAAVKKAASLTPKKHFVIIDTIIDLPNVTSVVFKEHEGSFLVGALAAMKSKKDKIGFVGGMNVPMIQNFACGYAQGAKYINPNITILSKTVGKIDDISPWNNPKRGEKLGIELAQANADVIFAAAGGTGKAVYKAAKDANIYAIGVDQNQNYMIPGTMLTSMVKKVDSVIEKVLIDGQKQQLKTGTISMGLKEGAVGWALDENNKDLISDEMKMRAEQIRQDIIDGTINVHDYRINNKCPAQLL